MTRDDLEVTGERIIARLHVLIVAVVFGGVALVVSGITMGVSIVRSFDHERDDRDKIDQRNREVTIIVGECLTKYRLAYLSPDGLPDVRACVDDKFKKIDGTSEP